MAHFDTTTLMTTFLTIGILGTLMGVMRRGKPAAFDEAGGTIAPNKIICIGVMVGGLAILALGLWLTLFQNVAPAGLPLTLLGVAGILTPLRSFSTLHDVTWSQAAIEGPSKVSGLTLGKTRARIDWSDVKRIGYAISGNWYVEASDGRRVYWTPIHSGYGKLVTAIKHMRPDLKMPKGL